MLRNGVPKSGRSIIASNSAAIQNRWMCVRQQPEDGDDLELQFLRFVGHPLGERVQLQIEIADPENGDDQEDAHYDHQDVRFAGRRDEGGQMMRSQWMKLIAQIPLHVSLKSRQH